MIVGSSSSVGRASQFQPAPLSTWIHWKLRTDGSMWMWSLIRCGKHALEWVASQLPKTDLCYSGIWRKTHVRRNVPRSTLILMQGQRSRCLPTYPMKTSSQIAFKLHLSCQKDKFCFSHFSNTQISIALIPTMQAPVNGNSRSLISDLKYNRVCVYLFVS